ncbi:dihydrolipoyllysine-residue acetyltransferase [Parazoarcus communis]|uniref:Acetyltransferase component of pyruvate dehydrogenase complex n=1 Tax=Parazoarcus communis SWub3 = DSM 12120 TaxID=1121029 RepID=A0A323UWM8_9RHOO|nr:dihydrolipoyllysine-residue acetyltransferase [Parazoarcus communis]NMG69095.1 dihydrolipoyllysine-residue acetyltransferase [Parazoarcus communis SWub3 = DSM 12120]PZA16949.1 dihydrolipoyllysine-residue acetyltransferase [Azoarcus communis] [Parazoarcus communis SWub3 = DSM 12120]
MSQLIEVKVPDIGDFSDVPVIELFVKVGDTIKVDDAIATLESDKATMDVPSSAAGVVREILVNVGDKVSQGSLMIKVEAAGAAAAAPSAAPAAAPAPVAAPAPAAAAAPVAATGGGVVDVTVPDIGDFSDVPVIELFVKVGDTIKVDDAIATLESDKATMDVPSSTAGVVREVLVKLGDKVSQGTVMIKVETAGSAPASVATPAAVAPLAAAPAAAPVSVPAATPSASAAPSAVKLGGKVHASPSVRAYARELGVDLAQVKASGPKNRILKEDVTAFIKGAMSTGVVPGKTPAAAAVGSLGGGLDLLPWPKVDFSKFGEVEVKPLSRIKKISGQNLARNWAMIPAVTYHEDADITDLEAFRVQMNKEFEKSGKKLTMLAFIIKASVRALQEFPEFNTSLDGDNLVYKKYFNIAFAADTPNGLVVPVVKDADKKSVFDIAAETGSLAKKARDGKLGPADMSGACFTISSLGGIGGTYFAPIVNAPEVAILGVNKSVMKPVWDGKQFVPRLTLPMSLTADHRVIDGALATRFNVYLAQLLADFRRVML